MRIVRAQKIWRSGMARRAVLLGIFAVLCAAGFGCGGNSNPVPQITGLSPSSVPAGEGAFTLTISGTNMNQGSTVSVGSNQLPVLGVEQPQCSSGTNCPVELLVSVPAIQVAVSGPQTVNVTTAGQISNSLTLTVASPQIMTVTPVAVPAGSATFPLTLAVLNAAPTVEVQFGAAGNNNPPLVPAGQVSCNPGAACTVIVSVPAASVKTTGIVQVTVTNPNATSGGTASTNFLVTNAAPGSSFPVPQSASSGTLGNASSAHSSVSDGGVFVVFDSLATNLTSTPTNGLSQIYLIQNCFGATGCTPSTTLISQNSGAAGSGGILGSVTPSISSDGRYITFASDDTNLAAGVNHPVQQIYLDDTCNSINGPVQSCTPALTLISTNGVSPGNAASANPVVSSFGVYVAYQSLATNLVPIPPPTGTEQVYLYQNCTSASGTVSNCSAGTTLISVNSSGVPGDGNSSSPSIDPAGTAVVFSSLADDIVPNLASNGDQQIYLTTTCLQGTPVLQPGCTSQTLLVSADTSNKPGTSDSITPTLTDNGGLFAAFATSAANLLPATASGQQIVGLSLCPRLPTTLSCVPSGLHLFSVSANGTAGTGTSSSPAASGGNLVFTSTGSLISGVSGTQVYGVPTCMTAQCTIAPVLISADSTGTAITGDLGSIGGGGMAAFFTTGSAGAPGTGEIFLAAPF
jgi:hypothetical protein